MSSPEKERAPRPSGAPSWAVPLGVLLLGVLGMSAFLVVRSRGGGPSAPRVTEAPAPSAPPAKVPPKRALQPTPPPSGGFGRALQPRGGLERYLEATRYPPTCRPLSPGSLDREPETSPPSTSVQGTKSGGRVELHRRQDMQYVAEGESAIVTLEVLIDGKPSTAEPMLTTLAKLEGRPRVASALGASVLFRDDGVAPDEKAHDGTLRAAIPFRKEDLGAFVGDVQLEASFRAGEATFQSVYGFVYTGAAPAHFTGRVREGVEDGSLVLTMGIDVARAGAYGVRGRLYDADGNAVALLTADGALSPDVREVKLVAFGRLLRDASGRSPYSLRDVEGFLDHREGYPERLKVPSFPGPYVTRQYPPSAFSDREWSSPEKDRIVQEMRAKIVATPPD